MFHLILRLDFSRCFCFALHPPGSWPTGFQEILASASHLLQEDWEYRFALSHLAFLREFQWWNAGHEA